MKKNKEKKEKWVDDGRVIAPMNVPGMPWYDERAAKSAKLDNQGESTNKEEFSYKNLSKEEKKAYRQETRGIIGGIILRLLPFILGGVAVFGLVILIMWLSWR